MGNNQPVSPDQLLKIRHLDDFDLIMLISEIHDQGWDVARKTLEIMPYGKSQLQQPRPGRQLDHEAN